MGCTAVLLGRTHAARPLGALAVVLVVLACGRGGHAADHPPGPPPAPVTVAETVRKDVPDTVKAVGAVQAYVTVSVRPLVTGAVVGVSFKDGDEVRQGQRLFQIDPRPYQAALAQARATLARAREQARNARADAQRYAGLVRKGFVTQQQFDTAQTTAAALHADVAADEAAVRRAELDVENCSIASPITGRTGAVLVQLGNVVQANQPNPLVVIAQIRPVYVAFTVPEQQLPALRAGRALKVLADVPSGPPREGTLTFINNTVDPTAGTILAKATFPNRDEALWPGQYVNVRVIVGVRHDAVVAPAAAVVAGQSGAFVWVVRGDGTVEQRPVQVAVSDAKEAVIARGIGAGEKVVTDGQLRLVPNARVVVRGGDATAGAAPAADRAGATPRAQARTP